MAPYTLLRNIKILKIITFMTDGTIYFTVTLTITEQKVAFELYNSVSSTSIKIVVTEKKYSLVHLSLFLFQIIINPFGL